MSPSGTERHVVLQRRWHRHHAGRGPMGAPRGRYAVWIGSYAADTGQQAVTLSAGMRPPPPIFNLTAAARRCYARRLGLRDTNGADELVRRRQRVRRGHGDRRSQSAMPDSEFCTGYVDTHMPSAVLDYDGQGMLAFAAMARRGRREGGHDDGGPHARRRRGAAPTTSTASDPVIGIENATAGRYAVGSGRSAQDARYLTPTLTLSETMPIGRRCRSTGGGGAALLGRDLHGAPPATPARRFA